MHGMLRRRANTCVTCKSASAVLLFLKSEESERFYHYLLHRNQAGKCSGQCPRRWPLNQTRSACRSLRRVLVDHNWASETLVVFPSLCRPNEQNELVLGLKFYQADVVPQQD